ncbi:MAG: CdaR family protein [Gemmatimonadota bacterium]
MSRLVGFLTESWGLKLAAVALAILLWAAVTANEPVRASFRSVDVEVDLRDPDWRLERVDPSGVTVRLLGPRGELVALADDLPRIVLPVERVNDTVESHVVPVQWVQAGLPAVARETRVLGLRPDTIRLYFERVASRTLPVQVQTRGELPEGLALDTPISTNPSVVEVRGPRNTLQDMDSVPLFPLDVSGLESTTRVLTGVDTTGFEGLRFRPAEVRVVLRVVRADSQPRLHPDSVERPLF